MWPRWCSTRCVSHAARYSRSNIKHGTAVGLTVSVLSPPLPVGSLFSICMTSVVNVVLTEVTLSTDASANYALGLFFFLFGALLARDIWTVRSARRRALHHSRHGGLSSSSINSLSPTSLLLHDPDDAETGEKIVEAFERQQRQQREYEESPVGRTSSERLISGSGLYSHQASHRLFSSLTSVRGRLFVPMVFVGVSALAVMLCLFVLEPEWTSHYPVALRTVFYTLLATSLLFTLAYLFLTFWRLLKIVGQAVLCASGCPWRGGGRSSGGGRSGYGHQSDPIFDVGEDAPDLFESLSLFASTSLLSSVAQVRIMAVCAAISGVYFGHMFGRLDREDQTKRYVVAAQEEDRSKLMACDGTTAMWLKRLTFWSFACSLLTPPQPSRPVRPA
jgi:hypothetical protein